jgi:hypothetical protein
MLIAGATAFSYVVAAVYEHSYARVFGIPPELIRVELPVILRSFGAIAGGWIGVWYVMNVVVSIPEGGIKSFRWRLIAIAILPAIIFGAGLLGVLGLHHWELVLFMVGVMGISITGVSYAIPLLYRSHPTYEAKYEAHRAAEAQYPDLIGLLHRHFGYRGLIILLTAGLSVLFALLAGSFEAMDQEVFLRPLHRRSEIVLRIYGENVVVAAFDAKTRTVLPRYRLLPIGDSTLVLRRYRIGKVRLARPATLR